jgi:hypothetical protein
VRELARAARRAYRERRARRHPRGPVDLARPAVELLAVARLEARHLEQDAHPHARPQACARRVLELALEVNAAPVGAHPRQAQLAQLVPEGRLGSLGGSGEEAQGQDACLT